MHRLIENKLIYGQLFEVADPNMIGRYNKALVGFGLKPVKLERFRIDMAGFSPEVAQELEDDLYLDPNGVNRRFIILSPEQMGLPVVQTAFSNTEELLYRFFEANARAITALTIKDVIYGEIEDSFFEVKDIDDLLSIEQVEFRVSTSADLLGKTNELNLMIDRLLKEPDAWRNDGMLNRMVEIARDTGDIRTNELSLSELIFRQNTYWTSHFGGVYVFIEEGGTTVICDPSAKGFRKSRPWQVSYIASADHANVYRFLEETGRMDPPRGSWIERTGLMEQRAEMLIVWLAMREDPKVDLTNVTPQWLSGWAARNAGVIEKDGMLPLLASARKNAADWSTLQMAEIAPQKRFALSRANPDHADFYLVNRLISEYLPFDFLTRFVFNKPGFYRDYEGWPENYREFVVRRIRDAYLSDKKALRRKLYK